MLLLRASAFAVLVFGAGCGFVREDVDGNITVDFVVDRETTHFDNELEVKPNDYAAVRDNCSSIDKATGQIRQVTIDLSTQANHSAGLGWGRIWMRGPTATDWPDVAENMACPIPEFELEGAGLPIADFEAVPLVDGQRVTVAMTPATRRRFASLVFTEKCDQEIQIKMVGCSDKGPVKFSGHITIVADAVAGL